MLLSRLHYAELALTKICSEHMAHSTLALEELVDAFDDETKAM